MLQMNDNLPHDYNVQTGDNNDIQATCTSTF